MTEETALYLTRDEGQLLLGRAAEIPGGSPERILALRKRGLTLEIAAGAVEVAAARGRARGRFADADRLFFTSDSLSQATSPQIAAYHAGVLAPFGRIADLGCGVGLDAIAIAEAGARVTALDRDPARLVFARANARARGVAERITFVEGDVTELSWDADAVFWDPSRRKDDGRRVSRHAERYEPPLSFLDSLRGRVRGGLIKLSPALPDDVLAELGGSIRFLSEGRECREACVAFGEAREGAEIAALLLPEPAIFTPTEEPEGVADPATYLFDPDPAIVRAGAVGDLCARLCAGRLSRADAYLTGPELPADGELRRAASVYRIVDVAPYRPRDIGARLRADGIGRIIVKKRHFSREPDAVARELGLSGKGAETTLVLILQSDSTHVCVRCEPVERALG
jgi:SAM-dependent methyltransferase